MALERIAGTFLWYDRRGHGRNIALLHGFPLDRRIWSDQFDALSNQYCITLPDLRGFGRSRDEKPFTIESLADDVHALLKQTGALPCVLGGLSMGGYVSLAFAKKYASDLLGLILIDTRAEADSPAAKEGRAKMIDMAKTGGSAAVSDAMMPKLVPANVNADVVERLKKITLECPPLTIQHALEAMRDRPDYTSVLESLQIPVQVVVGELDSITPPDVATAMQRRCKRGRLAVIPGAGHLSPIESPTDLTRTIDEFVQSV